MCRHSGKARVLRVKQVVCLLNEATPEAAQLKDGQLQVHWLRAKERIGVMFDFDRVEIVQAEDVEVPRLCMDVYGNEQAGRRRRYRQLPCRVWVAVALGPNTWQLLQDTFGQVERVEPEQTEE